jgi:predicted MFS family arabinose efflux permease
LRAFYRDSLLAVAVGTATVMPGFLVGALSLQIRSDLDAHLTVVAAGVTVFFAAGAIAAGPVGRVTERVGAITSMRVATVVTGIALIAIALFARSLPVLMGLLVVCGVANGTAQPAINLFMAEEVDLTRQGFAFGVKQSAIPAATTIAGLSLPLLALPLGWRPTVAVCAALVLVIAAATGLRARLGVSETAAAKAAEGKQRLRLTPELLLLSVGAACSSFAPGALAAYLVASAVDIGISEGAAGVGLALGSAASFVARISLGIRADRRNDYGFTVIVALLAGGSLGFVLLATEAQVPFLIGAFVAFTLGWGWPGLFNLAVVEKYRATPAAATGVTQAGIYVGAASGPAVFGLLSSAIGYSAAWACTAGVLLVAATVIWIAQSRFGTPESGTPKTGAEAGIRHI